MNFKKKNIGIAFLILFSIVIVSLVLYPYANRGTTPQSGDVVHFIRPAFAESMSTTPTFLDEEAGISAYVNIAQPIDLTDAKTAYRALEKETANYTVGSVNVSTSENDDVHCFAHKDGWIVAYYLKGEPMSKIVDWNLWSSDTSKLTKNRLQIGLEKMTNALGVVLPTVNYYHYQYSNANKCMIIIETLTGYGEDSFNVTIPNDITVYERSWSHYSEHLGGGQYSYFKVDGNTINTIYGLWDTVTNRGTLTVGQLIPGAPHIVSVTSEYAAAYTHAICVALVYQEP